MTTPMLETFNELCRENNAACSKLGGRITRGMCTTHYKRWNKYGDPHTVPKHHGKHGMHRTPTYGSWEAMNQRANNPKIAYWDCYGGRGIKVCDRWRSFTAFLEDMGERPGGMTGCPAKSLWLVMTGFRGRGWR